MYPALAVAEAMRQHRPNDTFFFVGSAEGFERSLVEQAGIGFAAYDEIQGGPLHGVNPLRAVTSLLKLSRGTVQALRLVNRHKPQVLLLTGGWGGFPVALAARLRRVPALVYLPDIEPGRAIRILQRFTRQIAITASESAAFFPGGKTIVTGYPVGQRMLDAVDQRARALEYFKLAADRRTLLVFGGSRGARSINIALLNILPTLLAAGIQVLHITGTLDWERVREVSQELHDTTHYHAFPYLHHDMGLAFAAADLAVCRAGASVLGELPLFGVPSILVPYPYAWRYQKVNADYLAERGAAIRMNDEDMATELLTTIQGLLNDPGRLDRMRAKVAALARPDAAWQIGQALVRLGGGRA